MEIKDAMLKRHYEKIMAENFPDLLIGKNPRFRKSNKSQTK